MLFDPAASDSQTQATPTAAWEKGKTIPRLAKQYGMQSAFFGGVDARALISNDRAIIDAEMEWAIAKLSSRPCSISLSAAAA